MDGDDAMKKKDDDASMEEDAFAGVEVPKWRDQITVRGLVVSFAMGSLFCLTIQKLLLTTGIIPGFNMAAGLIGFFLVKTWNKLLEKVGVVTKPFTRQENTVIQTCVIACCGIAVSGGFGTYIIAMDERSRNQSGPTDFRPNGPSSVKNPQLTWLYAFIITVSFVGLFSVVPLRRIMIIDYKLPYPSGTATAVLINSFHTPKDENKAKKQIKILGKYFTISFLWSFFKWFYSGDGDCGFGNFPILGLKAQENGAIFNVLQAFIAMALILGDGLYNLLKILAVTIIAFYKQQKKKQMATLPLSHDKPEEALPPLEAQRNEIFMKDRVPLWFAASGYTALAAISMGVIPKLFPSAKWYYILISYLIAPVMGFCNAYGCGLTDCSLVSTYGKIGIFIFAAWAGQDGGVLAGLALCGVMMIIVQTASDLMQDFKTGYLTLSSPRSMFAGQILGTLMGCILAPLTFWLFWVAFDVGISKEYQTPYAVVYREMALLGIGGVSTLPKHCLSLSCGFFAFSLLTNFIKDLLPKKVSMYIPIPMAMAIPFFIGPYFGIDMALGSLVNAVWGRLNKREADLLGPAVASGLICGDGIWTLPAAVLALAKVNPSICMAFLFRGQAAKLSG
ncbi:hypothetical protein AMTR_s00154p00065510 [Amborella trichopoda]|uniref:Metal-nicotianamine transporter YSL6 n=1 Tax=Amborella trichopoda TaxID=13333 RepID=W1PIJ7_AMBTC|nr:hypothetical protein AMTR_s00154p00065510 [Amborella trichopoda]